MSQLALCFHSTIQTKLQLQQLLTFEFKMQVHSEIYFKALHFTTAEFLPYYLFSSPQNISLNHRQFSNGDQIGRGRNTSRH